ncbi:MAG: ParA family protein [Gammaproteobacteria bacterium]
MRRIISIANQKGGVGKTTTAVNLAAALSKTKRKTLLIDMDPQGNATTASGLAKNEKTLFFVALGNNIKDCIQPTKNDYDAIPGGTDLLGYEAAINDSHITVEHLKTTLGPLDYDFIILDTPPSLHPITISSLIASNHTIVPLQCEYYSLEGITSLMDTLTKLNNKNLTNNRIIGILRTMVDMRNNLAKDVSDELEKHFKEKLFNTIVPRNVKLAEAPSHGKSGIDYMPDSLGSKAYLALAGELLRRLQYV